MSPDGARIIEIAITVLQPVSSRLLHAASRRKMPIARQPHSRLSQIFSSPHSRNLPCRQNFAASATVQGSSLRLHPFPIQPVRHQPEVHNRGINSRCRATSEWPGRGLLLRGVRAREPGGPRSCTRARCTGEANGDRVSSSTGRVVFRVAPMPAKAQTHEGAKSTQLPTLLSRPASVMQYSATARNRPTSRGSPHIFLFDLLLKGALGPNRWSSREGRETKPLAPDSVKNLAVGANRRSSREGRETKPTAREEYRNTG